MVVLPFNKICSLYVTSLSYNTASYQTMLNKLGQRYQLIEKWLSFSIKHLELFRGADMNEKPNRIW